MTLNERIEALPLKKQFESAIEFAETALPIWIDFTKENKTEYIDSIVGVFHKIDKNLLQRALTEAKRIVALSDFTERFGKGHLIEKFYEEFSEPIVALQDTDWELPHQAELIFYAIYNLIYGLNENKATTFGDNPVSVSINQSIDCLTAYGILTFNKVFEIIKKYEK